MPPRTSHNLSYEECEAWMRDLGYVDGKKLDWKRLLRDADVGTGQYVVKNRWAKDESKRDRASIREALERAEMKRRERTPSGARIHHLEDWNEAGRVLASNPELLAAELARVQALAAGELKREAARQLLADADKEQAAVLGSPTPAPKKPRK